MYKEKMHEMSIALNVLDIASEQCRRADCAEIESIHVKIGKASGVFCDALLFAFDAAKQDSIAKNASLHIEEVPVTGLCSDCDKDFAVEEQYILSCPLCKGTSFTITGGRELDIIDIEAV
ncbi:MAG: hydrogenase maturation nickel metallochaperone HypA [Nitrospiraceae bacterium]|jgi:hydrogenase nickel incorporation protein HypA/HybF|nr:MAG: hydrogenase maturation nickel metallochaperone HypA [Nitrospiraceae bacterium]